MEPFSLGEEEAKNLLSLGYLLKRLIDLSMGGRLGFQPRGACGKVREKTQMENSTFGVLNTRAA